MIDNSKQVLIPDEKLISPSKFSIWLDDHIPYRLQRFYWETDIFHPGRVVRKILNILHWSLFLWNDVDWDYSSLYEVLHFKLRNMRKHFEKHHNHVDWQESVDQLKLVEDCISRLKEADYARELWDAYHDKYPRMFEDMIDLPNGMKQSKPMTEEQSAELRKIIDEEERQWQDDMKLFTENFAKNIRGWWD